MEIVGSGVAINIDGVRKKKVPRDPMHMHIHTYTLYNISGKKK